MTVMIVFSAVGVAIVAVGYGVAWQKFGTAGICGWTALSVLLLLILAASTDSGQRFSVMAPLAISFLSLSLGTLVSLNANRRN